MIKSKPRKLNRLKVAFIGIGVLSLYCADCAVQAEHSWSADQECSAKMACMGEVRSSVMEIFSNTAWF